MPKIPYTPVCGKTVVLGFTETTNMKDYQNPKKNHRKKLWWIFYVVGSYFTGCNVYNNFKKFRRFGSVITERHAEFAEKIFPK